MISVITYGGMGYESLVFADENGLTFRDTANNRKLYKWETIRHIYHVDRYNFLEVIDERECVSSGRVLSDHLFGSTPDKIKYIWEMWRSKIPDAEHINTFKYPNSLLEKNASNKYSILLGTPLLRGIFILFLLIGIIYPRALVLVLFFLICHLWVSITHLIDLQKKKVTIISFFRRRLELVYDDNSVKSLNLDTIYKMNIENPRKVGMIVFSDGTKLKNLDRFSCWVVLREHLLRRTSSAAL